MVTESGVQVCLFTKLVSAECNEGRLDIVVLCGVEGMYGLKAKAFVDATGDAVLSFFAGVPCEVGGEKGETQAPTLCSIFANVDWDKYRAFLKMTAQGGNLRQTLEKAISEGAFTVPDLHLPGAFRTGNKVASMNVDHNVDHIYGVNCTRDTEITSAMLQGRRVMQEFLAFYRKYVSGGLTSDKASYITGEILVVNGGLGL